ncbi:MAG: AAA family ATPase, partial [Endomicrobium sp.]|nr:AAA family ATPase [Endomicrobium sp.]
MKKLPIGIQTFEKLISGNAVYVDKTEDIYKLINSGSVYFLS